ncbi:sulfotransferase family protein [Coleofasciculus chthonoplastes]|uniref:sulfotransferase family protein n=1 Tax=Coleofasciculus chthonoplastes TaxID=64178 RepID=UPI0032FF9B0D
MNWGKSDRRSGNFMVLPNFLIIGAAKAGTSSLYYYLQQHPQIYMSPVKEPKFFALEGEPLDFQGPDQGINRTSRTSLAAYSELFQDVSDEIAIGEASPLYLYSFKAAIRIKHYLPNVKLIAILRHPVDRAFSSFAHLVREGYETLSFAEALREEPTRIQQKWAPLFYYKQQGFYYTQLKRYFDTFERSQIKLYLYEELAANSTAVVQDIFRFLGVDDTFIPDLSRKNISGVPKSRRLYSLFNRDNPIKSALKPFFSEQLRRSIAEKFDKQNLGAKPILLPEDRQDLLKLYKEDILKLQNLIQRDLSHWIT